MRVTITHREEDGWLPSTKRHYVDCTVLLSEEEKAIVRARGLSSHYIIVDPEVPPPAASLGTIATLLKVLAPLTFLGGCVAGIGVTFAGHNHTADAITGCRFLGAFAMFLGGVALRRHIHIAEQPQQTITLARLLSNATFSLYASDNARAKAADAELRLTLARIKEGLLENRDTVAAESFEL